MSNEYSINRFINKIESAKNKNGIKYKDIAKQSGYSTKHLLRIRNKERSPKLKDAEKIVDAIKYLKKNKI